MIEKTLVLSDCVAPTPAQQGTGRRGRHCRQFPGSSLRPILKSHTNVIKFTHDVWKENDYMPLCQARHQIGFDLSLILY